MDEKNVNLQTEDAVQENNQYSLNDDRRVKVLSPTALVVNRFVRNRTAIAGLIILIFMFSFAFIGGIISPYAEDQLFYRTDLISKEYAAAIENTDLRYITNEGQSFSSIIQAKMVLAIQQKNYNFNYDGVEYTVTKEGEDFYTCSSNGVIIGLGSKDVFSASAQNASISFDFHYNVRKAYDQNLSEFVADGKTYTIDEAGVVMCGNEEVGYISRYVVQSFSSDIFLTRDFKEKLLEALDAKIDDFVYTDDNGETYEYKINYNPDTNKYSVMQYRESYVYDTYSSPSKDHWLGTDRNGMDMLTRLMYGGRVSLVIGFIVELISTFLGIIFGGLAGYFGGWVDEIIMRIVDVFYCIPSTPIIIILGAAMDQMNVDPQIRMIYLMLVLGFLGWPGMARLIRGQILSLREQEFMTATEACGISVKRRIFKHLVPNVIPQIIVSVSMGVGGTIITESTLSFLGLGVKFPFASWGNIINDVNNLFVLTNYWFIWIPAGVLLLLTVLAFNLVGDGLRDAFDPKMKR